jgi:hypothetical protein
VQPLGRMSGTSARSSLVVVIEVGGLAGGERPRRRLPGAEAVTEEAAAAVIMTCFVVVCFVFLVWWRCGVCAGK